VSRPIDLAQLVANQSDRQPTETKALVSGAIDRARLAANQSHRQVTENKKLVACLNDLPVGQLADASH
jgi:hypothetical protein